MQVNGVTARIYILIENVSLVGIDLRYVLRAASAADCRADLSCFYIAL